CFMHGDAMYVCKKYACIEIDSRPLIPALPRMSRQPRACAHNVHAYHKFGTEQPCRPWPLSARPHTRRNGTNGEQIQRRCSDLTLAGAWRQGGAQQPWREAGEARDGKGRADWLVVGGVA